MSDLNLVVELDAITNTGVCQRTAVDSSVHADLDIVTDTDPTNLGDLLPDAFLVGKAEAFAADNRARLNDHPLADADIVVQGYSRGQPTALANHTTGTDEALRTDGDAWADLRTAFNHRTSTDASAGINLGIRSNHGAGMNSRYSPGLWIEQVGDARISEVRVGDDQRVAGKTFGICGFEQDRGRVAFTEVLAVLRIGQKAQLPRPSFLKGRQASDFQLLGATQGGAEELGQLTEFHGHSHVQRDWFMRSMTWRVMSY
ncbi:hypothetical protein D3C78_847190 [compost metagenome]